jgi:hypothetical protein
VIEQEKRQRLERDAAVSDLGLQESQGSAATVRTVMVDRGQQRPSLRM